MKRYCSLPCHEFGCTAWVVHGHWPCLKGLHLHAAASNVGVLPQTKHSNASRSLEALKAVEEWQQEECELVKAQVQSVWVQDSSAFQQCKRWKALQPYGPHWCNAHWQPGHLLLMQEPR